MNGLPSTLSVCMIVKNEGTILGRCLVSIKPAADEIIVVDTGSNDNSVRVAEDYGAKVILAQWKDDFAWARNISIQAAQSRWILWLDADDVVPPDSISLINKLKEEKPNKVFGMIVRNQKPNGTGTEFMQARMFPNHPSIKFERPIHEQVMPSALRLGFKLVKTSVVIEHHGYVDPEDMKKKASRNVALLLKYCKTEVPDLVTCIEIADSYSIMGDRENAKVWYTKVIELPVRGKSAETIVSQAYMGLGNILNRKEEYQEACDCFNQAHVLCPERTDVLYCLAVSQEMMGDNTHAADTLTKIVGMEYKALTVGVDYRQTEIKAYLRLARILHDLGKKDDLDALCSRALEKLDNRPEIRNMAGLAYFQLNKLMESLHCFERSLKIVIEGNIDAYIGLCMIYDRVGKQALVEQTITNIKPLFSSLPKYWALCDLVGLAAEAGPVSQGVNRENIVEAKEGIEKKYRIQ